MIELGFLSSRSVQSAISESSLVLQAEKRIDLGPCNDVRGYLGIGVGEPRSRGTSKEGVVRVLR